MIRLAALAAAVVCAGAALHLSGAVAASAPDRQTQVAAEGGESGALTDILGRVDAPADVVPATGRDGGEELLVAAEPFVPARVEVAAAGARAPVDPMGLERSGELEIPEDGGRAGWWSGGVLAGEPGPTVIVGHVDFRGGQAGVFHALDLVEPGDRARVFSEEGRYLEYEITEMETHAKADFPTDEVYGPTAGAELRLITCGGPFSHLRRSYRDNVIAYGVLVATSVGGPGGG